MGGENVLLISLAVKLLYEKCMDISQEHNDFAWLRGLKRFVQASLTQALSMHRQDNTAVHSTAWRNTKTVGVTMTTFKQLLLMCNTGHIAFAP